MTIYEEKEVTHKSTIPVKTICDMCGREQTPYENFIEVRHEYGYGSEKDGDYIEFDICENCMEEIIEHFGIKTRYYEYDYLYTEDEGLE